ncbi:hypothetical protein TNCT_359321, partial [Trichonephila clavata]
SLRNCEGTGRVVPRRKSRSRTPPPRSGGGAVVARRPFGRDVFRTRIPVFPRFRGKEVGQDSLPSPPPPDARCRGGPQIEIVSKISGQVDTLYGEDLSEVSGLRVMIETPLEWVGSESPDVVDWFPMNEPDRVRNLSTCQVAR